MIWDCPHVAPILLAIKYDILGGGILGGGILGGGILGGGILGGAWGFPNKYKFSVKVKIR